MDNNFKINTSDLLNNRHVPQEAAAHPHSSSLASDCWQWMGEHKEAIGTAVGAVALAAGAVWLGREMLAGRLGAAPRTMAAAERALASSAPQHIAKADAQEILAQIAAARAKGGTVATASGYEQMLANLAAGGRAPAGGAVLPASFEGNVISMGLESGVQRELTAAEKLMYATHDGGVHHAKAVVGDDLMRDLLGVDPLPGQLSLADETLLNMRRADADVPGTFARQMPGLHFDMPALRIRKTEL